MNPDTAIAVLRAYGYDTSALELEAALRTYYEQFCTPTETDLAYARFRTPAVRDLDEAPVRPHFWEERRPRVLGCDTLWTGHLVSLSPGQRAILRDKYGMTPTAQIEVLEVERFSKPYEEYVRAVTVRSTTPAEARRHVLSLVRITHFGNFLEAAFNLDASLREIGVEGSEKQPTTKATQRQKERQKLVDELAEQYA